MNSWIIMDNPGNAGHAYLSDFGNIPKSHFSIQFSLLFFFCDLLFSHGPRVLVTEQSLVPLRLKFEIGFTKKGSSRNFPNSLTFFQNFPKSSTTIRRHPGLPKRPYCEILYDKASVQTKG